MIIQPQSSSIDLIEVFEERLVGWGIRNDSEVISNSQNVRQASSITGEPENMGFVVFREASFVVFDECVDPASLAFKERGSIEALLINAVLVDDGFEHLIGVCEEWRRWVPVVEVGIQVINRPAETTLRGVIVFPHDFKVLHDFFFHEGPPCIVVTAQCIVVGIDGADELGRSEVLIGR